MKIHPTESAVVLLLAVGVDYSSPNSVLQLVLMNYYLFFFKIYFAYLEQVKLHVSPDPKFRERSGTEIWTRV